VEPSLQNTAKYAGYVSITRIRYFAASLQPRNDSRRRRCNRNHHLGIFRAARDSFGYIAVGSLQLHLQFDHRRYVRAQASAALRTFRFFSEFYSITLLSLSLFLSLSIATRAAGGGARAKRGNNSGPRRGRIKKVRLEEESRVSLLFPSPPFPASRHRRRYAGK